jgi:uncharacterized membrane protein YkvA (DUF1232 family)
MEINETNEVSKASESNDEKAQELLDKGIPDAQQVIQDPSRMDVVMALLEDKLNKYPEIGKKLTDIPLMTAMLKAWEAKEYTEVSTKTVSRLVSAILYLVKENDLLWDNIPHVGLADDLAVLGLALKFSKRDLNAFSEWKAAQA